MVKSIWWAECERVKNEKEGSTNYIPIVQLTLYVKSASTPVLRQRKFFSASILFNLGPYRAVLYIYILPVLRVN